MRIVRIDTEGSGLSHLRTDLEQAIKRGEQSIQSIDGIVDQVFRVLEEIGDAQHGSLGVVIVRHSMSGITACEMAIASPLESHQGFGVEF